MLKDIGNNTVDDDVDTGYLIWQFFRYYRAFDWEWPEEFPVVGLKTGEIYENRSTDEYLAIVEDVSNHQQEHGPFHVETWDRESERVDADEQMLDPDEVRHLLTNRVLYRVSA